MPVPELSLTEERIVLLLAEGRSTREIATDVGLDERTVNWHLARAARKLEHASALHRHVSTRRGNATELGLNSPRHGLETKGRGEVVEPGQQASEGGRER